MSKLIKKIRNPKAHLRNIVSAQYIAIAFWYFSLFPGRIGFDAALSLRLLRSHKSTDIWTSSYFWILRLTSIDGLAIFIPSLVGILTLFFTIRYFINSLPIDKNLREKILLLITFTPIFGVFGVSIGHDVYLTSGILLVTGIEIRRSLKLNELRIFQILFISSILLITSYLGILILFVYLAYLIFANIRRSALMVLCTSCLLIAISSIGINHQKTGPRIFYPIASDIKCIVQQPNAEIQEEDWRVLLQIANKDVWLKPISCDNTDEATFLVNNSNFNKIKYLSLIKTYLNLASSNSPTILMSHINKSRIALPPLLFPTPSNFMSLVANEPVGIMSNKSLQTGVEFLHTSVDDPAVKNQFKLMRPLSFFPLLLTFPFNLMSWFWGWGGLWFIPFLIFVLVFRPMKRIPIGIFLPTLVLHISIFIFGPASLPRYVMSTVIIGAISTVLLLRIEFLRIKESFNSE